MDLRSYYKSLPKPVPPKTEFIKRIASLCNVTENAVRLWVAGDTMPASEEHIEILSRETGIKKEELFV